MPSGFSALRDCKMRRYSRRSSPAARAQHVRLGQPEAGHEAGQAQGEAEHDDADGEADRALRRCPPMPQRADGPADQSQGGQGGQPPAVEQPM